MHGTRERMQADLTAAMRERDTVRTKVLRATLSLVANAEAVDPADHGDATEVQRRHLTEDDIRSIVGAERADLVTTAAELRVLGRAAEADDLAIRAAILGAYV